MPLLGDCDIGTVTSNQTEAPEVWLWHARINISAPPTRRPFSTSLRTVKENNIYNGQIHRQKEQVPQRTSKPKPQKEITFLQLSGPQKLFTLHKQGPKGSGSWEGHIISYLWHHEHPDQQHLWAHFRASLQPDVFQKSSYSHPWRHPEGSVSAVAWKTS